MIPTQRPKSQYTTVPFVAPRIAAPTVSLPSTLLDHSVDCGCFANSSANACPPASRTV